MSNPQDTPVVISDTRPEDPFWRQLRDNVRELLEARGMTQKTLSAESGIPYSTLNKKIRGVHQTWWAADFSRLYDVFDGDALLFRGLTEAARDARVA